MLCLSSFNAVQEVALALWRVVLYRPSCQIKQNSSSLVEWQSGVTPIRDGFVSLVGSNVQIPLKILRLQQPMTPTKWTPCCCYQWKLTLVTLS